MGQRETLVSTFGVSSTRPILQWKNVTRQFRRSSVESNIPRNFSSSAASGGKKAYLKGKILITPDLRIFSFSELKTATKSFSKDRLVGEGAFGKVYKGRLDEENGSGLVFAVKKLNPEGFQGLQEWQSEVNFLGRLSHPNLVKLLGYCWEENELLLVYEFMQKGNLENHLFGRASAVQPLPWGIRLSILIGAARGLQFLHTSEVAVIHRDFKTANILLDEINGHEVGTRVVKAIATKLIDCKMDRMNLSGCMVTSVPRLFAFLCVEWLGRVYKGLLDEKNGRGLVFAVKKLSRGHARISEWQAELNFLGSLSHPNLVKLLGYCWEEDELLLVYEFMPKSSLENHLFGRGSAVQPLPWGIRLNILIGAARGLEFLHTSELPVIYRDFKTSNILLDEVSYLQ
ncbi:hypothetical protein C3L33_18731, partial [Rhododendron williamsianum]